MTKNIRKSLTIGIPVFNESATIGSLLNSIYKQNSESYCLDKVIVLCDGSTDNTPEIVSGMKRMYGNLKVFNYKKNHGKARRLNELFKMSQSDLLLILDGDIFLGSDSFIEEMVSSFEKREIGLVSSNNQPLPGDSLVAKITETAELLWYEARKNIKGGDNVYNTSGCAVALSKDFYKSIKLPINLIADQHYIYFQAKKLGYSFVFNKKAKIYYYTPGNIRDWLLLMSRTASEEEYGEMVGPTYSEKAKAVITMLTKRPIITILTSIYLSIFRLLRVEEDKMTVSGSWVRLTSTKK